MTEQAHEDRIEKELEKVITSEGFCPKGHELHEGNCPTCYAMAENVGDPVPPKTPCPLCHYVHADNPELPAVMSCPWKVDKPGSDEELTLTITVPRRVMEDALKEPRLWMNLWGVTMRKQVFDAATDLKLFAANGFKHLTTPEEAKACSEKIKFLESPEKRIQIMPAGSHKPTIAQRRLNRMERRRQKG